MKIPKKTFVVSPYAKLTKKGKSEPIKVTLNSRYSTEHMIIQGKTANGPS